jgi:hypothetical protein
MCLDVLGQQEQYERSLTSPPRSTSPLRVVPPVMVGLLCVQRTKAECVHVIKGQALPRASHSGEIALLS